MTPAEILTAARMMVDRAEGSAIQVWPRVGAFLARQSLEVSLTAFWRRSTTMHGVDACPKATQLICLRTSVPLDLAHDVAATWASLSRACHYYAYELAPTATELTAWFDTVDRLITHLDAQ